MKPYDKKYIDSEDAVNFTMPFKSGSVNVSMCIFYGIDLLAFSIYLNFCYRHSFCPMTPINPSSLPIFALRLIPVDVPMPSCLSNESSRATQRCACLTMWEINCLKFSRIFPSTESFLIHSSCTKAWLFHAIQLVPICKNGAIWWENKKDCKEKLSA